MDELHSAWENTLRHYDCPLKYETAKALFRGELEARWERFKAEAREAGYTRLTVGKHPAWSDARGDMIFAEPPRRQKLSPHNSSVPLWRRMSELLGGLSCANGLRTVDQVQLRIPPEALATIVGVHDL